MSFFKNNIFKEQLSKRNNSEDVKGKVYEKCLCSSGQNVFFFPIQEISSIFPPPILVCHIILIPIYSLFLFCPVLSNSSYKNIPPSKNISLDYLSRHNEIFILMFSDYADFNLRK